ncbi:phosphoglycolate phosphatase [Penicillium angulare]|uniref:Phosphoglycolate phosphatase n=1 Tax=Penicillium angulare TaxID=116970 RepID=A0A9W9F4F6_9EURO|nr:phosphoglycolate phosphatase [Penicillium angulare]
MAPPKFVIFDFDGTLFDTHQAIAHSITLTFEKLLPSHSPSESEVQRLIGSGMGLKDVLNTVHPEPSTFNEEEWTSTYRDLYASHGQQLVGPFNGAQRLLHFLKSRDIPISIVSNKGVAAVLTALSNHDLADCIPQSLIIGDKTPGATRKPDPASFFNVLVPALREQGLVENIDASDVFVIGDTEADLQFAANIGGARSIWCRYGYGDRQSCEKLNPGATIDSLEEVERLVDQW